MHIAFVESNPGRLLSKRVRYPFRHSLSARAWWTIVSETMAPRNKTFLRSRAFELKPRLDPTLFNSFKNRSLLSPLFNLSIKLFLSKPLKTFSSISSATKKMHQKAILKKAPLTWKWKKIMLVFFASKESFVIKIFMNAFKTKKTAPANSCHRPGLTKYDLCFLLDTNREGTLVPCRLSTRA